MITKANSGYFNYVSTCGNVSLTAFDYADFLKKMDALKKDVENEFKPRVSMELTKTEKIKVMGKFTKKIDKNSTILRSLHFNHEAKELVLTNGYLMLICSHDEGESQDLFYHAETAAKGILVEDTSIEGKYPAYSKIIPDESRYTERLRVNVPGWKQLCGKLKDYGKGHLSVKIKDGNIYSQAGDENILFEGFCELNQQAILFNPEYLAECLYFLSGKCEMLVGSEQISVMFKREKDTALLMRIRS